MYFYVFIKQSKIIKYECGIKFESHCTGLWLFLLLIILQ